MKELSIEQKVKACDSNYKVYTELINRLENVKEAIKKQNYGIAMDVLCKPYPEFQVTTHSELKGSEDEDIKHFLVDFIKVCRWTEKKDQGWPSREKCIAWLEKQSNLMKALQISNARIGELIEKNYYLKEQLEKQGKNNMGISEATKQKLEDNLNKALQKETPESWNKFLNEQGEQKPIKEHNACEFCEDRYGCVSPCSMKLIEEEKFTYKVKPKFEIGDLITNGILVGKIDEIHEFGYHAYFGDHYADVPDAEYWHKWTIQDAKDGDVLVHNGCTFIFMGIKNGLVQAIEENLLDNTNPVCFGEPDKDGDYHPATKEQCDLLFQKMKEAGYEWDAEKKELKKVEKKKDIHNKLTAFEFSLKHIIEEAIECGDIRNLKNDADLLLRIARKTSWSEEDEKMFEHIIAKATLHFSSINYLDEEEINFLKSLKDRVQPKQEWGEEDNRMCKAIIDNIQAICEEGYFVGNIDSDELIKWLKSLKERYVWKPSDEQMDALHYVTNFDYGGHKATLVSLYEQLKKLKG